MTRRDPALLRGIALFVLGLGLFACMDTTVKHLAATRPVPAIVAARYIGNLLLMVALLAPTQPRRLTGTTRTGLVLVRGCCLAVTSLLVGLGLQRMPVAETTAINFLGPMLVVLVAGPVLRERIAAADWAAAVLGFGGVLLMVRPGSGLDPLGVGFVLAAVGASVGYQLLSRVLATSERTVAMLFYTALVGSVLFGLALPWTWAGAPPRGIELLLFCCLGVFGGLGHFLFTAAYRAVPASTLAPLTYLQLLWAGLLGWLVFGQLPDPLSAAGMAVIAASGLLATLKPRPRSQVAGDHDEVLPD